MAPFGWIFVALALVPGANPKPEPVIVPPALVAPLELPKALPARRDLPRTVLVQVTVGVDGVTSEIGLAPGDTTPSALAQVAIDALKKAKLSPATRGGEPIAVRIVVPVTLGAVTRVTELRFDRKELEPVPTVAEGIEGVVLERGTRRPVAGVAVKLGEREVLTDEDGRFAFREVPKGRYAVEVPFFDEESARAKVSVPGKVTLRVTPDSLREYRTKIVGNTTSTSDASRIRIPVERAREIPGSNGDPVKVLESLPGVARPAAAGPGAGELAVRGSAPEDSQAYLEGMPIFQLYHFGNIYSVLQDEWIDDIDFRAGGFSTEYGDIIGGMVNVTLEELKRDGAHGHGDVNIYHAAGLLTVPVSDEWTMGAAVRRSWVDAILAGISNESGAQLFSSAPRYYDYQVRADYHPGGVTRMKFVAFGSDDEVIVFGGGPDADDPEGSGFSLGRMFHQIQATGGLDLDKDLALSLGIASSYQRLELGVGDNSFELRFCPLTLRADLDYRGLKGWRLRGGLLGEVSRFRVELAVPRPDKEGEVSLPGEVRERFDLTEAGYAGRIDGWGEATWSLTERVNLSGGFRLASWIGKNFQDFAPDLRLAAGWKATDSTVLTLTGGLNHQAPAPDESAESIGNTELLPERAAYINLGMSQQLGELFSVELQGFYKALDQLVVTSGTFGGVPYDNAGEGTIFGGEALVRLQHPIVDAWVAYTLSRSRRVDRPGEPERFFSFDQTHVLALVAGVQLGAGWRIGARVRYATGNPFTPLEPAYFDAGADVWVPRASGDALSDRAGAFFQLDLRVDKTFIFDRWKLDLYLELNNATNRANIESIQYSDDYRERDDITSLPLTPSLGVRGSF
jgi:hypothetical protein